MSFDHTILRFFVFTLVASLFIGGSPVHAAGNELMKRSNVNEALADPPPLIFTQQGAKLVGTGNQGDAWQGGSVAVSACGNTAIFGGRFDNGGSGAAWMWTRSPNGVWTQQGDKLRGTGAVGNAHQGASVAISDDGNTVAIGGNMDSSAGAVWIFTRIGNTWT